MREGEGAREKYKLAGQGKSVIVLVWRRWRARLKACLGLAKPNPVETGRLANNNR